ncbi:MAG TPA: tyrosine--tRNA ligase [Solirubrobacterales bacterium]|nr:tyrosine--tRNA ligase [Solirubrobacterales bacterium]
MTDSRLQEGDLAAGAVEILPHGRLEEQLEQGRPLRVKLGIDPTAPDIHLGHVVVLDKLRAFQDAGHTVVLIVGDFTARVGDPSGQASERPVLSAEEIEENAATFQDQAFKVLDRGRTEVRRNSEWLDMGTDELFRLLRRFTIARLLERDDFARRMEEGRPISALELLYPVLQGYDSVAVKADVELGGTDQTFNLLFARDVQEALGEPAQSIVTMPILPGTDGVRRMSKSLGNYVGVTDPPEEMFGKLMSIADDTMDEYRHLLLGDDSGSGDDPGAAKRELARSLVERFHGADAAAAAEARFDRVHVQHLPPEDIEDMTLASDGVVHMPALLGDAFGLSRSEARRLIEGGGVRIGERVLEPGELDLPAAELDGEVLRVGKRRFKRLRAV